MNIRLSAFVLVCLVGLSFGADPRLEQGARFVAKGDYEMALGEYRAILAENSKSSEAYFAAAEVYMKMKDYLRALANYRLAYKFNPTMSEAYEGAAKVFEIGGDKNKAALELAKDPKNKPAPAAEVPAEDAEVVTEKVETKTEEKVEEKKEVKVEVKEEKIEAPKVEEVVKQEPIKEVETAKVEPVKSEPLKAEDPFEKGKALYAEGKYKEAAPLWREVLKKSPGHAGAYFYAGLTRYYLGEMDKAEFNLKKGLEYKDEGNEANYYLSLIAKKSNKSDLELKYLASYIKKAEPNAKNREAAEARIAEIKALKNAKTETKNEVASVKKEATISAETSTKIEEVSKAEIENVHQESDSNISDRPNFVPTLENANLLFMAKSYEASLKMYKALLETEQNPEERYFTMLQVGNIYRELRDFHSAVSRYREVVEQFPDSDWATEAERALEDAVWLEKHSSELPR